MSAAPSLTWLHVSDLHFGHGDAHYRFDQSGVTRAIVHDAKNMAQRLGSPDLILVTGDVAFSGKPTEYADAKTWLNSLCSAVGGSPRVYLVPGNHDVDRKHAEKFASASTHEKLRANPRQLDELLADGEQMQTIWPKLRAYAEFAKDFGHPELSAERPFYTQVIPCRLAGKLVVVGLNTALLCLDDKDSSQNLCLGRGQLFKAIEEQPRDVLLLVLQHHPQEWLLDGKDLSSQLQQRTHIQFSGHVHQQQGLMLAPLVGGSQLHFVAGAGHKDAKEEGRHAYSWGQLNEKGLAYHSLVWLPERKAFAPVQLLDTDDFKREDHAFVDRAQLPKSIRNWLPKAPSPSSTAPSRGTETLPSADSTIASMPILSAAVRFSPNNSGYHIPFRAKGTRLIGRQLPLEELARRLNASEHKHAGRVALIGIGGLGKTQLAVEYCHGHRDTYTGGIYWLDAGADIDGQLTALCDSAQWLNPESKHEEKLSVARYRIRSHSGCLLVFDNVEDLTNIQPYLPGVDNNSQILILSRVEQPGFQPIQLKLLSVEESLHLLEIESERSIARAEDRTAAEAIATQLDGLPLALELVGAHMRRRSSIGWAEYAKSLKEKGLSAHTFSWPSFVDESLTRHGADLHAALHLDEFFFRDNPLLRSVLDLLTWAAPTAMGESLLTSMLGRPDALGVADALDLSEQLRILSVEHDANGHRRVRMHRLVQQVRRQDVPKPQGPHLAIQAQSLGEWFLHRRMDFAYLAIFEAELEHLRTWHEYVDQEELWEAVVRLRWLEAYPPYHRGQYPHALTIVLAARALYESHALDFPLIYADLLADLGSIYRSMDQPQEACELAQQALVIRRGLLGEKHPETVMSLGNLGAVYSALDKPKEALKLEQQVLAVSRELLGEKHPDTARALGNLGTTYSDLDQPQEALKLAQQALAIRREVQGEKHPDTAIALGNLGAVYSALNQPQEAFKLATQALAIRREVLGEKHPDTATALSNLGAVYSDLGQIQEALRCQQQALAIRREVLGERHPGTARAHNSLGTTYFVLKKYTEALTHQKAALYCAIELFGLGHPTTIMYRVNVAKDWVALQQRIVGLKVLREGLRDLPADHPGWATLKKAESELLDTAGRQFQRGWRNPSKQVGKKRRR